MAGSDINEEMKVAAAEALAGLVGDELSETISSPRRSIRCVGPAVAKAVAEARAQERRSKALSLTGGTKRPCRRSYRRQTGMEHLTGRDAE